VVLSGTLEGQRGRGALEGLLAQVSRRALPYRSRSSGTWRNSPSDYRGRGPHLARVCLAHYSTAQNARHGRSALQTYLWWSCRSEQPPKIQTVRVVQPLCILPLKTEDGTVPCCSGRVGQIRNPRNNMPLAPQSRKGGKPPCKTCTLNTPVRSMARWWR
jgi:hypothetical protein